LGKTERQSPICLAFLIGFYFKSRFAELPRDPECGIGATPRSRVAVLSRIRKLEIGDFEFAFKPLLHLACGSSDSPESLPNGIGQV
jgi:hypothetical protein